MLMSGSRFLTAGLTLLLLSMVLNKSKADAEQWKNALFTGFMLLCVGTGGMVWALQFISSGMVALMVSVQPLVVVLMMWKLLGKKPSSKTLGGTILGMLGMAFLVGQDQFISSKDALIGILVISISILSWGYASIYIGKVRMPDSKMQSAGIQMIAGGLSLLIISTITGEIGKFSIQEVSTRGALSWFYLVIFGSLIAYSAFNYLLVKSSPEKVATSNYVNPVVAMLLGWGFNNEVITGQSLFAAVMMLTGVFFINTHFRFSRNFRFARPHPLASLLPPGKEVVMEIDVQPFTSPDVPIGNVIARIWHGASLANNANMYIEWAKKNIVPEFQSVPGNLGITFFHRTEGNITHFTFISYWTDIDAIRQFAGADYTLARFYPEEKDMLLKGEKKVRHQKVTP
jgi:drug/metabolite transporter (DMT)-like permease